MANLPDFRAVVKVGGKRWSEIGAAWIKDKGNLSVSLNFTPMPRSGKANFLLVPVNAE